MYVLKPKTLSHSLLHPWCEGPWRLFVALNFPLFTSLLDSIPVKAVVDPPKVAQVQAGKVMQVALWIQVGQNTAEWLGE